jgi:nicotinamide-nucleotide adenylyltransferase
LKRALFIGRFQPFHRGHLRAVQHIFSRAGFLYVAVGSAQKSHELDNPFTSGERLMMIKAALDDAGIDCRRWLVVPVPDAVAHAVWTASIDALVPRYDVVFSNDPLTLRLFRERRVRAEPVPLHNRTVYQATEIRRRMQEGASWRRLVPPAVARLLEEFQAEQRMLEIRG